MHWLARRYRGVSIALFLLLLIYQVPARTLAWLAPENLTVSGLTGTVWAGEAARAWVTIDGKPLMWAVWIGRFGPGDSFGVLPFSSRQHGQTKS